MLEQTTPSGRTLRPTNTPNEKLPTIIAIAQVQLLMKPPHFRTRFQKSWRCCTWTIRFSFCTSTQRFSRSSASAIRSRMMASMMEVSSVDSDTAPTDAGSTFPPQSRRCRWWTFPTATLATVGRSQVQRPLR